jgi:phosphopantetheinyl transferase
VQTAVQHGEPRSRCMRGLSTSLLSRALSGQPWRTEEGYQVSHKPRARLKLCNPHTVLHTG